MMSWVEKKHGKGWIKQQLNVQNALIMKHTTFLFKFEVLMNPLRSFTSAASAAIDGEKIEHFPHPNKTYFGTIRSPRRIDHMNMGFSL
mmetsp:Transcript_8939/g.13551  ORF Transcript_8939/g.13551 Transcript_8939/m.13551 type:complete len:88 (-) Transcript_8939:43-306(-)